MPLITICDGCGEEIEGVTQGRYELEIPTGSEWWASERLTFHGRGCLALWVDRTDPDGTFCPQCAPDALPPGADSPTPVSDGHHALRFATHDQRMQYIDSLFDKCPRPAHFQPIIDGHKVPADVRIIEVMCGEDGWAIAEMRDEFCDVHHVNLLRVNRGNVSVGLS